MLKHIESVKEFDEVIKNGAVMIDFYADWCGPCKMLSPIIEEVAEEYNGRASVYKLNVDNVSEIASRFGVFSIPTVIFFKNGEPVEMLTGYRPKNHFEKVLDRMI